MAEKYEARPVTEEDMTRERDEFPYGLFVDGRVHGFFQTQTEADGALRMVKMETAVQEHLKEFVSTESYMMEIL